MNQQQWEAFQSLLSRAVVVALLVIAGGWCYKTFSNAAPVFATEEAMARYTTLYENCDKQEVRDPFRKGRVLLLVEPSAEDLSQQLKLHEKHQELPEEIRATHGQVDTLAVVCYEKVAVGSYSHGATGYRVDTRITLLDAKKGRFMGVLKVEGKAPPDTIEYTVLSKEARTVEGRPASVLSLVTSLPAR